MYSDFSLDSLLRIILQHRREEVLELQEHRPNPLASSVRYATRAKEAVRLAKLLSGASTHTEEIVWLPPTTCTLPPIDDIEEDTIGVDVDEEEALPQPEQVLLDDVLDSGDYEDEEDSQEATPTVKFIWNPPHVSYVFFV